MREFQRAAHPVQRDISDGGALLATLFRLWPSICPAHRRDLKARVILATVLLFVAKFATVAVPFTFKWATDALAGHGTAPITASSWLTWALPVPVAMTLAYGSTPI